MTMRWIAGGVTAANGFRAAGLAAGIKRSGLPDLSLVVSEIDAAAAGVFTTNRVQAAPVSISRDRLRRGRARAIVLNSGCANCLTGPRGRRDALSMTRAVARALGITPAQVLVASTGQIGTRLPIRGIQAAIPALVSRARRGGHRAAARGILTTDRVTKEAAAEVRIAGRRCRLGGMAKGSGMIAPGMATMLCVLTTDLGLPAGLLRRVLREAVARTFNRISVDGDMSTNDCVVALANGCSGVTVRPGTRAARVVEGLVEAVTERLARMIVRDGEGATRVLDIRVCGGRDDSDAQAAARSVARSPLVKTMLAGADLNPGRIAAALGASSARFDPRRLEVVIGPRRVVARGVRVPIDRAAGRALLNRPEVTVHINLGAGRGQGRMVTCDLTKAYVDINAHYST